MAETTPVRCAGLTPALAVGDVAAAIDWYVRVLGFEEQWRWGDPPVHASVTWDGYEIHLSATKPDPGGSWLYFLVSDVDALYERLVEHDVAIRHPPQDQEWGMRELPIEDLAGNELTLGTPCIAKEPKLEIEREGLEVRLEKRLAALLRDLAEHKGFDLGELLEETLLHTFEPVDHDGVASPHTVAQLDHIRTLKQKHGIDYDVHASYRFVERSEG